VVFDPLTNGFSIGEVMGEASSMAVGSRRAPRIACGIRSRRLEDGRIEFTTTNLSTPNPVEGKRILLSMWDHQGRLSREPRTA
jgi:hypothetical protein